MASIINFESYEALEQYFKNNKLIFIDSGSEGESYYSRKDNLVYKKLFSKDFLSELYDVDNVITEKKSKAKSFLFPKTIFSIEQKVFGTVTKYVNKDYLKTYVSGEIEDIKKINFDRLIESYYKMREDTITLTKEKTSIYDLSYNILFDGKSLYGIDTLGYKKDDNITEEKNIYRLDSAIKDCFGMWTDYDEMAKKEVESFKDAEIEEYLRNVESIFAPKRKSKVRVKK